MGWLMASFGVLFGTAWVIGLIVSLASSGLVLYILYRIANHPW